MNDTVLRRTDSIKDLGIDISSSLVWNDHIRRVVNKCNKKMGMIKRAIGFNAPEKVSRSLFTALVRSDVEYGSSLWSGTSKCNLQLIEGNQRRATNYILHYPDIDYRERLTAHNRQKWKRVFLTCPCHKIYRGEAVGLKSCKYTWKITIFVKMWNLGQYRENLIFCQ